MSKFILCPMCSSWKTRHLETIDNGSEHKAPIRRVYICDNCHNKFEERFELKFVRREIIK